MGKLLAWIRATWSASWFPLALLALFLFTIPGVVLFVLHLLGYTSEVNAWLEPYSLSFHLAVPWYLALLLLSLPFLVVLLYFLKLKRQALQVPSTFLWKKSIEDLHVNSLFQWLRQNILLVLQLLTLLFLIYALLGLRIHGRVTSGRHYIIMIDNSASMSTTDANGRSRLDQAKEQALNEIDAAAANDIGMVIVFNSTARPLQLKTNDKSKLRQAVQQIEKTNRPTQFWEALRQVDGYANPLQSTEDVAMRPENENPETARVYVPPEGQPTDVFVYSDGGFPELTDAELSKLNPRQAGNTSVLGNIRLQFQAIGTNAPEEVNNIGIVGFAVSRMTDKWGKNVDPNQLTLQTLIRVLNFRNRPADNVKMFLDVYVDDKLSHTEVVTLDLTAAKYDRQGDNNKQSTVKGVSETSPGEVVAVTRANKINKLSVPGPVVLQLPGLPLNRNISMHAYLKGVNDDFPIDNSAWLTVSRPRKAKVLIVTPGNVILDAFFNQKGTQEIASTQWLPVTALTDGTYREAAITNQVDLVFFDRCAPKSVDDMPEANTFFLGAVPPPWILTEKKVKAPLLTISRPEHLLLRQLRSLWDVDVFEVFYFDPIANLAKEYRDQYALNPEDGEKLSLPTPRILVEGPKQLPILFTISRRGYEDAVLAFSLFDKDGALQTNWPLQPGFPLFLRNVVHAQGRVADTIQSTTILPGQTMTFQPDATIKELTRVDPRGEKQTRERDGRFGFEFTDTDALGLYKAVAKDEIVAERAVSLLDEQESDVRVRKALKIGEDIIVSGETTWQPQEIWKWLIVVALALLILEWFLYCRRIVI